MTHAPNQGNRPHSADYLALNPAQRNRVHNVLRDLGIDTDGHTLDDGVPTLTYRAAISAQLAAEVGIHLAHGHEIALCTDCLTIADAEDMREGTDGGWRCDVLDPFETSCHAVYARQYEQD